MESLHSLFLSLCLLFLLPLALFRAVSFTFSLSRGCFINLTTRPSFSHREFLEHQMHRHALHPHVNVHTDDGTQKKHVTENLDFLSLSFISLFGLKAPAVSARWRTLNTSHELYVNVRKCAWVYVSTNACVNGVIIQSPLTRGVSLSLSFSFSLSSKHWSFEQTFILNFMEGKTKSEQHQFTYLFPFIPMIVILTTMSPVFQVFAHSSSLLFSVDLRGQRRQSA